MILTYWRQISIGLACVAVVLFYLHYQNLVAKSEQLDAMVAKQKAFVVLQGKIGVIGQTLDKDLKT